MSIANLVQRPQSQFYSTPKSFMLQEILSQPKVIQDCLEKFINPAWGANANQQPMTKLHLPQKIWAKLERIQIIGCGSSYHAGLVAKYLLEQLAEIPTEVHYASEQAYANSPLTANTLTIAVSQSGESADTLQAVKIDKQRRSSQSSELASRILAIANKSNSSLEHLADSTIITPAGEEKAIAATKTFTAQVITFLMLALELATRRQTLPEIRIQQIINDLRQLPRQIEIMLPTQELYVQELVTFLAKSQHCIFWGRGINYAIALEGALKFKETTYIHAEGFAAGEFKHGHIALVDHNIPILAIASPHSRTFNKLLANVQQVKKRGAHLIGITPLDNPETAALFDHILPIPVGDELLSPIFNIIPLQLLADHLAVHRGLDVDHPRYLTKAVTFE